MHMPHSKKLLTRHASCLLSAVFSACILLFVVACAKPAGSNTVRVAYLPISASVIFFVAMENGYFDDEGIQIEPIRMGSANQAIDALLTNRADAGIMLGFTTLLTVAEKQPEIFRITQSAFETSEKYTSKILVHKDSEYLTINQLAGKKIATYTGLTQRMNLELILDKALGSRSGAEIVQVEQNLQVAGLESKQFDALFTIDPYTTTAIVNGSARSIVDSPRYKYIIQPFPTAANVLALNLLKSKPDTAKAFNNAMGKALEWTNKNPREAALIAGKEEYAAMPENISSQAGTYEWFATGPHNIDAVASLAKLMKANNLLTGEIDIKRMYLQTKDSF
jgi:NitT/TauT family transport system substrate-binding protein